ncbi:MAG TPA: hypothetical protein VH539_15540 [Gemmatimonadaceae bacterium]
MATASAARFSGSARGAINWHHAALDLIAADLMVKGRLSGAEVDAIFASSLRFG